MEELLIKFGYTKEQAQILLDNKMIKKLRPEVMHKHFTTTFTYLKSYGYTSNQIIKMSLKYLARS